MDGNSIQLKEYKTLRRAGIDDLEGYPGDMVTEWWTDEDWKKWKEDAPNRERRNKEYIDKLKAEGRFGEEYYTSLFLVPNPMYDDPKYGHPVKQGLDSYRFDVLNFGNDV